MIKEWHKECKGRGFVERGSYGVLHVSCDGCQGKGYTELKPVYKGIERNFSMKVYDVNEDSFWYALRTPEKFEVYIKEVKQ